MPLPALIGLGLGLAGTIGKLFGRKKANKKLTELGTQDPLYTENPFARKRLSYAQNVLNARMPGSAAMERNILGNQGNQLGRLDRTATDSSQALAAAAGIGANTDNQLFQLGIAEDQDYQNRLNSLYDAQEGVIREGDKVYGDQVRRYGNQLQIEGAKNENRQNTWGDISNFGFSLADFALAGGIGGGSRTAGGNRRGGMGVQRDSSGSVTVQGRVRPRLRIPFFNRRG